MCRSMIVTAQNGDADTVFKLKWTTKIGKVMAAFAAQKGVAAGSFKFVFDGKRISPEDTPETVIIYTSAY
jgi:small ubiquitin-related modifier